MLFCSVASILHIAQSAAAASLGLEWNPPVVS